MNYNTDHRLMQIDKGTGQKIGKYLAYQREKRKMSLHDFSSLSNLTPSFISRLEKGDYHSLTFDAIESLAKGFDIPVMEFLRKCEIVDEHLLNLPNVDFYLREKFQFPSEAVEDIKLFLTFIEKKYQKEIKALKKSHHDYWDK